MSDTNDETVNIYLLVHINSITAIRHNFVQKTLLPGALSKH